MSSIDQQFVEFVVKSLVGKPDEVKIERRIDEKGVLLELTVDPEDLGRVIGKRGATAQSLRTLLRALGTKNDARYNLKIIDNGLPNAGRPPRDDQASPSVSSDDDVTSSLPTNDDQIEEPAATPETEQEEVVEVEEVVTEPELEETTTSDRFSQTRKELEDLDDLDV
jgi:predicted RNA-binding protein YlqC (UPF0109 family)